MMSTRVLKILSLLLFILIPLGVTVLFLGTLLFVELFNDSGAPFLNVLLVNLVLNSPILVPALVFWIVSLIAYRRGKYGWAAGILGTFVLIYIVLSMLSMWRIENERKISMQENATRATVPAGFFTPTPKSIPDGFMQRLQEYRNNGFLVVYKSSLYPYADFRIYENSGDSGSYQTKLKLFRQFHINIQTFEYNGFPGVISSSIPVTIKTLANYDLLWNDNGRGLTISLDGVPSDRFPSSNILIDILKTLERR